MICFMHQLITMLYEFNDYVISQIHQLLGYNSIYHVLSTI
jgi:hypothetical protein